LAHQKKLYLTKVDSEFDENFDLVIDPWCLSDREDFHEITERIDFLESFPLLADVECEHQRLEPLLAHFVGYLAEKLNAHHGEDYPVEFWRIVLITWVSELTQRLWRHYVLIDKFREINGDEHLRVEVRPTAEQWPFQSVADVMDAMLGSSEFNHWLDSHIVAVLAPKNWQLQQAESLISPKSLLENHEQNLEDSLGWSITRYLKHVLGATEIAGTKWRGMLLCIWSTLFTSSLPIRDQQDKHLSDPETQFPENFIEMCKSIFEKSMPRNYREDFWLHKRYSRFVPFKSGRMRLGIRSKWNDRENIIAGFAKIAGERLVQVQHGGSYGTSALLFEASAIEYRNDAFITWGWNSHDDYKGTFVPLPSPYLRAKAGLHKETNDELVIVSNIINLRKTRVEMKPRGADYLHYCSDVEEFISALEPRVRNKTVYRPHFGEHIDIDTGIFISQKFPEMELVRQNLNERLLACRLAVIHGPGTTLNQALSSDIPTIGVWRKDHYPYAADSLRYFEELENSGIIFYDTEQAASHINRVWNDLESWWRSNEVQNARLRWCRQYAWTEDNWWWHWIKGIKKLAKSSTEFQA